MFVCSCHKVTDRQITRAMHEGARTLADIQEQLKVGTNCGSCLSHATQVIRDFKQQWPELDYNLAIEAA